MEQRTWRWTDAHFCSLPSQTSIYGCTRILNNESGTNKLLVASLVGRFFTIDYQRIFDKLTPSTKEIQFTYIPGKRNLTLYSIDVLIAWVNSVDPDQLAHLCHLIRIYTDHLDSLG
jgi:hypothetical protein